MSLACADSPSAGVDAQIDAIFQMAKRRDTASLENMKASVDSRSDRSLSIAYSLALYLAAPEKYEDQFVTNFPEDYEGVMLDLYRFEEEHRTPSFLFSFDALGRIAEHGNAQAMRKLVLAAAHSDGVVAEALCEVLGRLISERPRETRAALQKLPSPDRERTVECVKSATIEQYTKGSS